MQDFSARSAGQSEKLHIVGLETIFLGTEGEFLKLVMVLNASSCETATLTVLREMKEAEF